jgi:hypothetical protein
MRSCPASGRNAAQKKKGIIKEFQSTPVACAVRGGRRGTLFMQPVQEIAEEYYTCRSDEIQSTKIEGQLWGPSVFGVHDDIIRQPGHGGAI